MGARLTFDHVQQRVGFWRCYEDDAKRKCMDDFWSRVIEAGGDVPNEESLRIRRKMMIEAKLFDPRE